MKTLNGNQQEAICTNSKYAIQDDQLAGNPPNRAEDGPELTAQITSDTPHLLEGATATVRRMLGLAAEIPLPSIDAASQIKNLADFVHTIMKVQNPVGEARITMRDRKRAIAFVIRTLLTNSQRLLLEIGEDRLEGRPYIVDDVRGVWPLTDKTAAVRVMLTESGLNVSERAFKWLVHDLETAAYNQAPKLKLAHYWTRRGNALYVSSGPTRMIKASSSEVGSPLGEPVLKVLDNGAEEVYFASDAVLPVWEPSLEPLPPSHLTAFNPALIAPPEVPQYTVATQKLFLATWLTAMIADIRPLPLLAAIGQRDGGKTTLVKAICKLMLDGQPTTPSKDPRDLWTLAVRVPVLGLDNVDGSPPTWLPDFLAALVTGVSYDRRKLHTNTVIERRQARATTLVSTRTGLCVARPDVAQRTLPIMTGAFTEIRRKSDQAMMREIEHHRSAVLTWLVHHAAKMLAQIDQAPAELPSRFKDFAAIVWAFDSERSRAALASLQQAQALVVGEEDPLLRAIIENAEQLLGTEKSWQGRAKDLTDALKELGTDIPIGARGGKAIAYKLREGRSTLALFGLSLTDQHKNNSSYFTLKKS